jgi:hypothetical protein
VICSLNEVDPLPLALGAKVKPLNTAPLTPEQEKAAVTLAFEKSRMYDEAHAIDAAIRDSIDQYGFAAYWI